MKFDTITIFHAKTTEEKHENREIHQFPTKKRNEIHASLPQLGNNPDHGHEVKLLIQISHLSAKAQVFRKSRHLSLLHYFYYFNALVPQNK